jgi:hypothetical protein
MFKKKEITIIEAYKLLVIEGGINPDYFMDQMQVYELYPLLNNIFNKNKESWEQTRLIAYLIAQTNSTKHLKPSDILKFGWDCNETEEKETSISNEEITRLKNKATNYLNTL